MTLKNAALLALIGTILVTALLVWDLIFNVMNVLRGLVPVVMLFSALISAFGAFSVAVFFCGRALESVREPRQGAAQGIEVQRAALRP